MKLIQKIGIGTLFIAGTLIGTYGFVGSLMAFKERIHSDEEREITRQILDSNKDGKVDYKENIPFFEKTGSYFPNASREDVKKFVNYYISK
jgi:hypothetical protein